MKRMGSIMSAALAGGVLLTGVAASVRAETTLEDLDQKVRALERRLEIADEAAAAKAKESPSFTAGDKGFSWTSADKAYSLTLRGYVQADGRFFLDDDASQLTDTFLLRRARVIIEGQAGARLAFRIAPDFGNGQSQLQDGYVDFKSTDAFNIRFGRTKLPLGVERSQSPADTSFNETGLSTALTPNYDEGVMVYGSLAGGALDYALGVFNGALDGTSNDVDTNDDKDLIGRLWLTPFKNAGVAALGGLSLGVAGTVGKQSGTTNAPGLPSYRTSGQSTFFSYRTSATNSADTAVADGDRTRIAPQFYYSAGPIGLLGEYVIVEQEVANGKGPATLKNEAWQLAASWIITGEKASLKGIAPARPFDLSRGQWGAFELKARIGEMTIDDEAFSGGYAQSSRSAKSADATGVGMNWYLTRNAKFAIDYEQTSFDGGAADNEDRPEEKVVIARAQLSF